jgi:hypothetical protein
VLQFRLLLQGTGQPVIGLHLLGLHRQEVELAARRCCFGVDRGRVLGTAQQAHGLAATALAQIPGHGRLDQRPHELGCGDRPTDIGTDLGTGPGDLGGQLLQGLAAFVDLTPQEPGEGSGLRRFRPYR